MSNPPLTPAPTPASTQGNKFNIGEEYGTARKSLPPAGIVAICLVVVIAIVAVYSYTHRARAHSTGNIDGVYSAPVPGQNMLIIAVNVTLENTAEKPSLIKSIQVSTDVGGQAQTDDAAPAVDATNYLQMLPDLKQNARQILATETRLNPGEKLSGTIVVGFPITPDAFEARKSLTVTITPYDEVPVVLKK
jgi:hypothetical protein